MRLDELERELRAERPEPASDFARKLDEWAAAGFPRGGELDTRGGRAGVHAWDDRLRGAWQRLAAVPPRRVLAPAGAAVVLLTVVAVAIQSVEFGADEDSGPTTALDAGRDTDAAAGAEVAPGGERRSDARLLAPAARDPATAAKDAPGTTIAPAPGIPGPAGPDGGGVARGAENRLVDATARLVLGAEEGDVQDVANRVVDVTDSHDGFVLDSQVTEDEAGARAAFTLEIPFRALDAAISDLSEVGDVVSRTEAGRDITAEAVRVRRELASVLGNLQTARVDLIEADSHEQRRIIRSRIEFLEARADRLRVAIAAVERRARFATVSVEVTSSQVGDGDDDWTLGDAVDDAGRVLTVGAGVALIVAAVLVPLGLIAALAWWIALRARARGRERVLDEG